MARSCDTRYRPHERKLPLFYPPAARAVRIVSFAHFVSRRTAKLAPSLLLIESAGGARGVVKIPNAESRARPRRPPAFYSIPTRPIDIPFLGGPGAPTFFPPSFNCQLPRELFAGYRLFQN